VDSGSVHVVTYMGRFSAFDKRYLHDMSGVHAIPGERAFFVLNPASSLFASNYSVLLT